MLSLCRLVLMLFTGYSMYDAEVVRGGVIHGFSIV